MPVVKRVTFDTAKNKTMPEVRNEIFTAFLQRNGGNKELMVERKGFGPVDVGLREIKNGMKYLGTLNELASTSAIPDVIQNGIQIWSNDNHKGREYPTFTFAAPIELNGKLYSMAVVVKRTSANKYKVHRVLMPDGAALEFLEAQNNDIKTKEAEATPNQMTAQMDGESRSITSASDDSVPQVGTSVNNNFMQNEEKDATLDYLLAGEKAKTRDPETLDRASGGLNWTTAR